jgi:hypothetical protein
LQKRIATAKSLAIPFRNHALWLRCATKERGTTAQDSWRTVFDVWCSEPLDDIAKFMEALSGQEDGKDWPFDENVYYLPGNHDHHLWNVAREKQYRENYVAKTLADDYIQAEFQTTNMLNDQRLNPVPCDFLNLAVKPLPRVSDVSFLTVYPNFALLTPDKKRCVVFHHGHYVESIYSLMTSLKKVFFPGEKDPRWIWDLEGENGAWIDFFWSALSRSGEVGEDVQLIYDKMQDIPAFNEVLANLTKSLAPKIPPKGVASSIKASLMRFALRHLVDPFVFREVHHVGSVLSKDAQTGLAKYLENYILGELERVLDPPVPQDMTFVFGHTHRPFESASSFEGYRNPVKLLNSGGWVVDTMEVSPLKGGAVIVVDDDLNVASVRMYNEHDTEQPFRVSVSAVEKEDSALFRDLNDNLDSSAEPWLGFSKLAEEAVLSHRQNLMFHLSTPE